MSMQPNDRAFDEEDERDRRYGLQHDPDDELAHELELADRLAEQASLPPGHWLAHAAARYRLGRGPNPYEQPHEPSPARLAVGDHVVHDGLDGPRSGRVIEAPDRDGLVEVDFGRYGTTVVAAQDLDREPH